MKRAGDLWRRYPGWIGAAVSAALALACYGFVLRLPFFLDDLPIMTWLSHHSWVDIWARSSENQFYRPLAFTIYKLGRLLPSGADRGFLHGVSLLVHWVSAVLIMQILRVTGRSAEESLVASILTVVFPFMFMAVPWITALSHPLVTVLTLLATFAALKAERDQVAGWWSLSLLVTILAPLAHESGQVCAIMVGGIVLIQHGVRSRRRVLLVTLGVLLNGGMMVLRQYIPRVGTPAFSGVQDAVQNGMYFLHGLTYPVAPLVGWLAREHGLQDLTLVGVAAACLLAALAWVTLRRGGWRWAASGLWWWAWAALPAGLSLRYGYLYASPRVYTLAAAGTVMVWSGLIFAVSGTLKKASLRNVVTVLLVGLIVTQNIAFLRHQFRLFSTLNDLYQEVLRAARNEENAPLGFVNLPKALAYPVKTYAMIQETVLFAPPYSNIAEFIEVNGERRPAEAVMYAPVLEETDFVFGFQGHGLDWEGMRRFALEHQTIWLAKWRDGRFSLDHVGRVEDRAPLPDDPLVRFEGGALIEGASAQALRDGAWAVRIVWAAEAPVDGRIFVHIRDVDDNLVAQADGPALGGMVPAWIWQPGDRVYDIRRVAPSGPPPYTIQAGIFQSAGRLPAYIDGVRCPEDAPTVTQVVP
ncbi:MAG: hypothetical protein PVI59_16000 [Anaerolineae bacterium]